MKQSGRKLKNSRRSLYTKYTDRNRVKDAGVTLVSNKFVPLISYCQPLFYPSNCFDKILDLFFFVNEHDALCSF